MTIRTVLVPVEDADHTGRVCDLAAMLARMFDGYVEGCPLGRLAFESIGAVEPMAGVVLATPESRPTATPGDLRERFDDAMRRAGIAPASAPSPALGCGWSGGELMTDDDFATRSRVFDIAVVGRPNPDHTGPRISTLESVLFEGGRPVLVTPPDLPPALGRTVVISWNRSTESARSVSFAMDLIRRAERVLVLTVEGGAVAGPTGAELCRTLAAHGVAAEERTVSPGRASVGETIRQQAVEYGADLIVKGAYTQSRLRQMVFGGPTSHLLYHAELPVLMAC